MLASLSTLPQGVRSLRRSPSFTLTALLVLALGIGASTAVFSIMYGILLRPLPYRDADRLVVIEAERDFDGPARPVPANFSLGDVDRWRPASGPFESAALFRAQVHALGGANGAEVAAGAYVTDAFFSTVGGQMTLGRPIDDDRSPVAVISHRLWIDRFGGAPDVLGRAVTLDTLSYTIVGVAGPGFDLPSPRTDVWTPAAFARTHDPTLAMPGNRGFHPVARLKPRGTLAAAQAFAGTVARALSREHPDGYGSMRVKALTLRDRVAGPVRPMLLMMFACTGLVLLVACANVANLMLARGVDRVRDAAVRVALGASRARLVKEAVTEAGLLAAGAAVLGLGTAFVLTRSIVQLAPPGLPRLDDVRMDGPALLFAAATAAAAALMVAVLPALRPVDAAADLKAGHGPTRGGRAGRSVRRALVILELAVSLTLIVGAALLGRSVLELLRTDVGVAIERLVVADLHLAFGRTLTVAQQASLAERLVRRAASLPGVQSAGLATARPPNRATFRVSLNRRDPATGEGSDVLIDAVAATPTYFRTAGMSLVAGRLFTPRDDATAPPVALVTADTARVLFGDEQAVGKTVSLPFYRDGVSGHEDVTVVGILANVKYSGLDRAAEGALYRPYAQHPLPMVFLAVRAGSDDVPLREALRGGIGREDPQVTIVAVNTLRESMRELTAEPRFRAWLLGLLAGLGVVLAAAGLYGVVAHSVSTRTAEIGVRIALGSTAGGVLSLVLREGLALALAGISLGLAGALAASRALRSLLYGVPPTDPLSFAAAAALVLLVTLMASYLPARRAMSVDPVAALRAE